MWDKGNRSTEVDTKHFRFKISTFNKIIRASSQYIKKPYWVSRNKDSETLWWVRKILGKDSSKLSSNSILKVINC